MPSSQNTLFTYFQKKQTPQKDTDTFNGNDRILKAKGNKKSPKIVQNKTDIKAAPFVAGDIVWAKLDGYPWWPSLVCNNQKNLCYKRGKQPQVHVQFFDDPPSRAWIKERFVKCFKGNEDFCLGSVYFSGDPSIIKGVGQADVALKSNVDERLKLVVEFQDSEEEEEDDCRYVETMDLDEDIFDAEKDNSKENYEELETNNNDSKSSGKTPARLSKAKRRRIIISDDKDESEDEYKPKASDKESSDEDVSSGVDEKALSGSEDSAMSDSPVKNRKRKRPSSTISNKTKSDAKSFMDNFSTPGRTMKSPSSTKTPSISPSCSKTPSSTRSPSSGFTPSVSQETKSKLSSFSAPDLTAAGDSSQGVQKVYLHNTLDWLKPSAIRDINKNRLGEEDYDPRTLYIPDGFKKDCTPAMRQWWEMKSQNFDTILFFKMGKFYELFHMDADVGVNILGIIYMKGDYAHSGFPEIAYGRYASVLVEKGYKVARIEQVETPAMMEERVKKLSKPTKFDKVVSREICRVTSKGTKTYSFIDGDVSGNTSNYLLAVSEKDCSECTGDMSTYGVCFVDTSVGKFYVGQFLDDRHGSRFRTLIAHYTPTQILFERGHLSQKTQTIIKNNLPSVIKEALSPGTEFWDSHKTLKYLSEADYFEQGGDIQWPDTIKKMMSEGDSLGHTAAETYQLAVRSLGAVIWYLKHCYIDQEMLSMKIFEEYTPIDKPSEQANTGLDGIEFAKGRHHMVLDGVTLSNLDVIENSNTGTLEGTLLERLDQCSTAFGKRLFHQWLCTPLCNPNSINDRLDAVEELMAMQDVVVECTEIMKKMPDLERLLQKVHTLGNANRSKNHPDSRAVFFEDGVYSKRKIDDFLSALSGFKQAMIVVKKFEKKSSTIKSGILRQTVTIKDDSNSGRFPYLTDILVDFDNAFDHDLAKSKGTIVPLPGVIKEYDDAMDDISSINKQLSKYLNQQKDNLGVRNITYVGTAKNRFQLEIPESAVKKIPHDWEIGSSRKGFKRFTSHQTRKFLSDIMEAENRRNEALRDSMRRIFESFDREYSQWSDAVQCLAVLDVLISLSLYSRCGDGVMCRPDIILPSSDAQPFLEIREGRHPCISRTFSGGDFIPNDTVIGVKDENDTEQSVQDDSRLVLVTGPNMGGKSTLMRQVGIITIMAQLGCYVPAEKCRLTPVDRVFTRLGASDRIMAGESTFFVELSETSAILQHATKHSLVLIDELGRGTATYDGTAIACAVVDELSRNIKSRCLFSTHYHSLVEEFSHDNNIRLGHMACMVENENEDDPSQETITFLYKFVKGACPKSYGFNAARLANLPEDVIKVAQLKASEFEQNLEAVKIFRALCSGDEMKVKKYMHLWK